MRTPFVALPVVSVLLLLSACGGSNPSASSSTSGSGGAGGGGGGSGGAGGAAAKPGSILGAFDLNDDFQRSLVVAPDLVLIAKPEEILRLDGQDALTHLASGATEPRLEGASHLTYTKPYNSNVATPPGFCRVSLPSGMLDATFGDMNGCVSAPDAQSYTTTIGLRALPGGGYAALLNPNCTNGCPAGEDSAAVLRLDKDGKRDASFGTDGVEFTSILPELAVLSFGVQKAGGLVVSGYTGLYALRLFRMHADGTLDTSFGDSGFAADAGGGSFLEVLPDDAILLMSTYNGDFRIERYTKDGAPDSAFGTSGKVDIEALTQSTFDNDLHLRAAHVDNAGRIYVTGLRKDDDKAPAKPFLLRLLGNGTLDTAFGDGGIVRDFGAKADAAYDWVSGVGEDGGGKVLVGVAHKSSGKRVIVRVSP